MSNAIKAVGGAVNDVAHGNLGHAIGGIGNAVGGALGQGDISTYLTLGGNKLAAGIGGLLAPGDVPGSPGANQGLQQTLAAQQQYAQQFRQALPQIQNNMQGQLAQQANQGMQQNLQTTRTNNSSRGLLYGGINAGQEGQDRAKAQKGLINADSALNSGLQSEANSLDQAATQTGVGIQQQQQAMQNSVYQNAMAQMAGQNQMLGSMGSAAALALLL